MSSGSRNAAQRVAVVTGGGAGIGAAIAKELARNGVFVVAMDPMVKLDGSGPLEEVADPSTVDRIVAAGGKARESGTSVTDGAAVRELFSGLVDEFGSLDAVVNAAGIVRQTDLSTGSDDDWAAVLGVHLDGYLNVLRAALPIMADAGHGRIVGVTSGAGWRPANTGAYSCAKRAVAALTWQIGRVPPSGVTINALSPIAATRMVTSAAPRPPDQQGSGASATGGLSLALGSMPPPENLGPIGSYLASEEFSWCSGQVIFSSGTEVALIAPPRLLEAARTRNVESLAHALNSIVPVAFTPAETHQATNGATNPRFGPVYDEPGGDNAGTSAAHTCAIVTDDRAWGTVLSEALTARGIACVGLGAWHSDAAGPTWVASGFPAAAEQLARLGREHPLDAVIVALGGPGPAGGEAAGAVSWKQILDDHAGITEKIHADAGWVRAVADYSASADRPVRVVTVTDAASSAGRTRSHAAAQLARGSQVGGSGVAAFSISVGTSEPSERRSVAELVAHLLGGGDTAALAGAELTAGSGWLGLHSHPHPAGSISFGGPSVPDWLDDVLRRMVTGEGKSV